MVYENITTNNLDFKNVKPTVGFVYRCTKHEYKTTQRFLVRNLNVLNVL